MADLGDVEAVARTTAGGAPFGITDAGFVPKPIGRLIEEKLSTARLLFGDDLDLTSGSALRKILELASMEEARCWEHLGRLYEGSFVARAKGEALSLLGAELGIPRPHHRARGRLELSLAKDLPASTTSLPLPRGTRLLTPGGHDYFLYDPVTLTNSVKKAEAEVRAFHPGPEQNLDPGVASQKLDRFNALDGRSNLVRTLEASLGGTVVSVKHTLPATGGELYWSDETYRDLLLAYPRNLWTPDAIRVAVARVPGVRQVQVKDRYGGLDIHQSIFGNFNFIERLFSEERSLGSPYYFTVLVAQDVGAVWDGPGQLRERVEEAVDRVRPAGIFPNLEVALDVGVSFQGSLTVEGLPIPGGTPSAVNASAEAQALKQRILARVRRYVQALGIGEPVRYSEILWAVMEEPGVTDCKQLRLRRYPPPVTSLTLIGTGTPGAQVLGSEADILPGPTEVAILVEELDAMTIL